MTRQQIIIAGFTNIYQMIDDLNSQIPNMATVPAGPDATAIFNGWGDVFPLLPSHRAPPSC
jgi:hypothetical protein